MNASAEPLVDFIRGTGRDHRGRRIADVLAFTDGDLEGVHDYIQWLFPLRERSNFNPHAPTLDPRQIHTIRSTPALQQVLLQALDRMLAFYGLARVTENDRVIVRRTDTFPRRAKNWVTPRNHNFLRITRILTSLRLLGLEAESKAFFEALESVYQENAVAISTPTFQYWENAATRVFEI